MSTVTVVATVEASNTPPRVRLDITDIGATVPSGTVTVNRLDPNGARVPVRTSDGNPLTLTTSGINKVGLLYDYEMPYGSTVQYATAEDPTSSSGDVTVPITVPWLIHPGVPELSQPIDLRIGSFEEETLPVKQGVFYPMGRQSPIVVSDGVRHSGQSSFTVMTETADELAGFRDLLYDSGPLLLNVPPGADLGVDTAYIAVADVTISRPSNIGGDWHRDIKLPYTVIERPSGGSQSERTLIDLLAFPTLDSLMATYATFTDLLAGP